MATPSYLHTRHPLWPQIASLLEPRRTMDVAGIAATFASDGVLHSMMGTPIRGQASIRKLLGRHLARLQRLEFEVVNMAVAGNAATLAQPGDACNHHFRYRTEEGSACRRRAGSSRRCRPGSCTPSDGCWTCRPRATPTAPPSPADR